VFPLVLAGTRPPDQKVLTRPPACVARASPPADRRPPTAVPGADRWGPAPPARSAL